MRTFRSHRAARCPREGHSIRTGCGRNRTIDTGSHACTCPDTGPYVYAQSSSNIGAHALAQSSSKSVSLSYLKSCRKIGAHAITHLCPKRRRA